MKKIAGVAAWVVIWGLAFSAAAQEKGETVKETLKMMYTEQSGYAPEELQKLRAMFQELTGITVNLEYVKYDSQYEKIAAAAAVYDVLTLDQIWVADLAAKALLAPLEGYVTKKMSQDVTPAALKAFQYQKQTWAFPFLVNFQLFFYNEKMLKTAGFEAPPQTLDALLAQMKALKQKELVEYPWTASWAQAESLLCDYVWLTGAYGGEIFDSAGNPTFDQKPGLMALAFMLKLLTEEFASPTILTKDELAVKDDMLNGRAAFSSNWLFQAGFFDNPGVPEPEESPEPEVIESAPAKPEAGPAAPAKAQPTPTPAKPEPPITKQVKVALLPASGTPKTASVSAFQGLAIPDASKKKDAAWKWIKFLTSPLVQRAYRFEMPIWTSVQASPEATQLDPLMAVKKEQLTNVHHRPNLPNYAAVSLILQKYLHLALEGEMEPRAALTQAKTEITAPIAETPTPTPKEPEKK